ncbi:hypothetical protein HaLaN_25087 [Haematococcus lacustris]|uniref:Uncharacterized protein n=1 Tax=Haematococcus lacustris TaxID=44745 RepID=A0A6A0A452_HAELA|nr:hypothetical protein HaLaN_25087 [Haematococcus lacustris]
MAVLEKLPLQAASDIASDLLKAVMRVPAVCVLHRIPGGRCQSAHSQLGALPVPAKEELPAQESVAADHLHDHCHAGARMPGRGPFDIRQQHLETLRQNLLAFIKRGSLPLDPSTWILAKH